MSNAGERKERPRLAKREIRRSAGRDAIRHGCKGMLARQVGFRDARVAIHVHPGHAIGQLGCLVEHYDIVVERQVQLWEVVFILGRLAERQLACEE